MRRATFWPRTLPWRFPAGWYAIQHGLQDLTFGSGRRSPTATGLRRSPRPRAPLGASAGGATENSRRADARYVSTSSAWRAVAPAELGAEDLGHPRGDRGAAVGELLGEPGPAGEHVVERQGELVADGPRDLGLEERTARDERPEQVELGPERDDGRGLGPVPGDQPRRRRPARSAATAAMVASSAAIRAEGVGVGRPDEAPVGGLARARRGRLAAEDGVDDVAGHDPVGRVLAAADPDDAVRLDRDPVLARRLDRRAVRRRDERPEARRTCRRRRPASGRRPSSR